jgi:hypothetical protein
MAKTWVLDSEAKGTGAQMVPLEKVLREPGRETALNLVQLVRPARGPRPEPESERREPRRFKVVDVMTRETLAEGAGTGQTVALLERVRSVVDVTISVWEPAAGRWRPLTLGEQGALWEFRGAGRRPVAT